MPQSVGPLDKVVIVMETLAMGGAERQVANLARHLRHRFGANVEVWAHHPGDAAELSDGLASAGIATRLIPVQVEGKVGYIRYLRALAGALRQARPTTIISALTGPNCSTALLWRSAGAQASVWVQHDEGLWRMNPLVERAAVKAAGTFVAVSPGARDFLVRHLGVQADRIHVISNSVELPAPARTRAEWRDELGVGDGTVMAVMVANLTALKDHRTLVRAWAEMDRRLATEPGDRPVLVLAGRLGSSAEDIVELVTACGLITRVRIPGSVTDIAGLLDAADIGVLSSRSEGLPVSVIEYMSRGLPIVGTDTPGIRAAVGPDGAGFLAPEGDVAALGQALENVVRDSALRQRAGALARQRAERCFSPEEMSERYVEVIRAAARPRTGGRSDS